MLLSIIIPAYNAEKQVSRCIGSIYEQDLDELSFEILLIDNNSTDQSLALAYNLQKKYSSLSVLQQCQQGVSATRNMGIQKAKGKYLMFVDADDYLLPHTLKEALSLTDTQDLDLLYFGHKRTQGYIFPLETLHTLETAQSGTEIYELLPYTSSACSFLFKKSFIDKEALLFNENIYIGEDALFVCQCILKAKKVNIYPVLVYFYELNPKSATALFSKDKIMGQCNNLSILLKWQNNTSGKARTIIQNLIALTLSQMIRQTAQFKYWKVYCELYKKLKAIKAYPLLLDSLSHSPKGFKFYGISIHLFFLHESLWHIYMRLFKSKL